MNRRTLMSLAGLGWLAGCVPDQPPAAIDDDEWHGTFLNDGPMLPEVDFTDQSGATFNLRLDQPTPVTMVFFGYLNCPDVCPGIMADMAAARRRLEADIAEKVTLLFVSTDPARDTPEAMQTYLERVDEQFIGLTADLASTIEAAKALGISMEKGKQLPSGGYEVDHSSQVLAFGKQRRMQLIWSMVAPGEMREDLARLVAVQ